MDRPEFLPHWDPGRADLILFAPVRFTRAVDVFADGPLLLGDLPVIAGFSWSPRSSGVTVPEAAADALEVAWAKHLGAVGRSEVSDPREVSSTNTYPEGTLKRVLVNRYERDRRARDECVARHGTDCIICGFSFPAVYGEVGEGFTHVHHLVPLSQAGGSYQVDPVKDLRPVCPNCHAMLHRTKQALTIRELRRRMREQAEVSRGTA